MKKAAQVLIVAAFTLPAGDGLLVAQSSCTLSLPPLVRTTYDDSGAFTAVIVPPGFGGGNAQAMVDGWNNACHFHNMPPLMVLSGTARSGGQNPRNSILINPVNGPTPPDGSGGFTLAEWLQGGSNTINFYLQKPDGSTIDWTSPQLLETWEHETGHALGLSHDTCSQGGIMAPGFNPGASILPDYCAKIESLQAPICSNASPKSFVNQCPPDCTCPGAPNPDDPLSGLNGECTYLPLLCGGGIFPWYMGFLSVSCHVETSPGPEDTIYVTTVCHAFLTNSDSGPASFAQDTPTNNGMDGYGPNISLTSIAEGASIYGTVPVTGAAVSPAGISQVSVWIDNLYVTLGNFAIHQPSTASCQYPTGGTDPDCPKIGFSGTLDTRTLADGAHTMTIVSLDRRAPYPLYSLFTRHFLVNNRCGGSQPPSISITAPAANATLSGTVSVTLSASDPVGVIQTSLYVDGTIVKVFPAPPYTYSWDTTTVTPGSHNLQARAADSCGNTAASHTTWVNVLAAPLRMYIDIPSYNSTVSGPSVSVVGWASDPYRITGLSFALDGQALALNGPYSYGGYRQDVCNVYPGDPNCPYVGFGASFDSTRYANGWHTLSVTATDGIGQQATANWSIAISNAQPPAVSVWWVEPQPLAGYGPPGSLIVAGSATGGNPNTGVQLWYQDVTAGQTNWSLVSYAPLPGAPPNGIWLNAILNANYFHTYAVLAIYSGVASAQCRYPGNNAMHWCP